MEQANNSEKSDLISRKRGVENLGKYVIANKKALLSKEENTNQLEDYIEDLKRVDHQAIINNVNKDYIYKVKNTPNYENKFRITNAQKWKGKQLMIEIGVRLEDTTGTLLTKKSRNELCPVEFFWEYIIKKNEIRYDGDVNIINNSPLTRERVINQHLSRYSYNENQMEIMGDLFTFNPSGVGNGITAVNEIKIEENTDLSSTQKYFYDRAKKFNTNIESDGYVYTWLPVCKLDSFLDSDFPFDTNFKPLEIKILENQNLTTKNLFVKYQKTDSTHFSDGTAVGATDKIDIAQIVCKIKIERMRIETIKYNSIFEEIMKKYSDNHINDGITITEGVELSHKEVSINTNEKDTGTVNIDVANFESSNTMILNLFTEDFPFKDVINSEPYSSTIVRDLKKIELKFYDTSDNTNRELTYDLDNRDDRMELFQNFKSCLIGNDDATFSPMAKFDSKVTPPKLNNYSYDTYWLKSTAGTSYVNRSNPIVLNLDKAKRSVLNVLPAVNIQGTYHLKVTLRNNPTTTVNLLISRDYIGGYKLQRKSIKDDPEIVYYPNSMKDV